MKFSPKQYAQALYESLEGTDPKHVDLVLDNFVQVLSLNNDIKQFEQIEEEFKKLEAGKKGIKFAEVTSAKPLSKQSEKDVIAELNKIVKGDLEIKKKIDENILGGVVVRLEDQLIDASVKKELQELKQNLTE